MSKKPQSGFSIFYLKQLFPTFSDQLMMTSSSRRSASYISFKICGILERSWAWCIATTHSKPWRRYRWAFLLLWQNCKQIIFVLTSFYRCSKLTILISKYIHCLKIGSLELWPVTVVQKCQRIEISRLLYVLRDQPRSFQILPCL